MERGELSPSGFTPVLSHLNLASLPQPEVPCEPSFCALQPPLFSAKGELLLLPMLKKQQYYERAWVALYVPRVSPKE